MKKIVLILSLISTLPAYANTNVSIPLKLPDIETIETEMEKFFSKLTPKQISSLNEEINDNTKKRIPNLLPNVLVKILKLTACKNETVKEKIENCAFYSCYEEIATMMGKYASELTVHGLNSANLCAITQNNQRLFIAKNDLKAFYELKNTKQSISSSFGSETKTTQTFKFENIECTVESSYKNVEKTDHLIEVKPSEISKYGITTEINGKTYAAKDGGAINFDFDLIIKEFKIIKGPMEECNKKRVTLFQELQKQGHLIVLESPKYKNLPRFK